MFKRKWKFILAWMLLFVFVINQAVPAMAATEEVTEPTIKATYRVLNQKATVSYEVKSEAKLKSVTYLQGLVTLENSIRWSVSGKKLSESGTFEVKKSGYYTFRAEDVNGGVTLQNIYVDMEFKAVWISYLEFKSTGYTKDEFETQIDEMFDNVVDMGMNAVIVHVRPFGDAMYDSSYFPWSKYISGTQGKDPGFDPLEYMVEAAHDRGLQFHAWLNPYRVTTKNTDVKTLAADNPARKWLTDKKTANDRNVLSFDGNLYYNPAVTEVRTLIRNGVLEIVQNYDVDGIHFDDYFYPTLGSNYEKVFDAAEYKTYVASCKAHGEKVLPIDEWRRQNVNLLVKGIYSEIKNENPDVVFGISPGGFLDTLRMKDRYYVDVDTWLSEPGYVDYICPQLYWSFEHKQYPFDGILNRWLELRKNTDVNVYVGIPVYKSATNDEPDFKKNANILADMIKTSRNTKLVDGYMFFRYDNFYSNTAQKAVNNLLKVLNK